MRRTILVIAGTSALLLRAMVIGRIADDSVEESGVTIGDVTELHNTSHAYQVMVYTGSDDIDELLTKERTLADGPVPGLSYLWFDDLDCGGKEVDALDLAPRSAFTVQRDSLVLLSSPPKLRAIDHVVAECPPSGLAN